MQKNRKIFTILFAVAVLVSLTVGIVSAAPVTQNITYQGKLTDAAGNPLTGTYSVTFKLYEVSSGGTAIATDTHTVTATKGLFTTQITADPSFFNGRALWIGIAVAGDPEMTPRQELRPVPYALSLRPGAVIIRPTLITDQPGDLNSPLPALNISTIFDFNRGATVKTIGTGSEGIIATTTGNFAPGITAVTSGDHSKGMSAQTSGLESNGLEVSVVGPNSHAILAYSLGDSTKAVYAYTAGSGSPAVYGESEKNVGVYGKGKEGGFFTTRAVGDLNNPTTALNISTTFDFNRGATVKTIGTGSEGIIATTTGNFAPGITAVTSGDHSKGMSAQTSGSESNGLEVSVVGPNSHAILAYSLGDSTKAVYAYTAGSGSPAVYGESSKDVGVYGKGKTGGFFTTNQIGTYGNENAGLNVSTILNYNPGVQASTKGDNSFGVNVTTSGSGSHAVYAKATGPSSNGVVAFSSQSPAIWAQTSRSDHKYGIQTPDIIRALSYETGASDVAEYIPVMGEVSPGAILVIGADGILQPSTIAYDTSVAGIVSTSPGISLGAKEGGNPGEQLIAVAGRVPCKVDATYGPIHPRDLLTTSDTPGYAMKAQPVNIGGVEIYRPGTTLGKAMGSLDSGTGTIEVLVMLQ